MRNSNLVIIIFMSVILASCGAKEVEFDKTTWNDREDFLYANRKIMVTDLMENHLHEGMTYQKVTNLLGEPENYADMDYNKIAYQIEVDYGWNIDPVSGSYLIIELANDSIVAGYELVEWEHYKRITSFYS
ncbi:hypothetical protein I2I11_08695 [Pontibacter sp. 172403-2]|uniref:hypothetical protein n=1 Tax=Pontibacter rufus TaxID=2791028 RepID=UPI0018AFEC8B|nr:hypothetical protein [Pontibacter sp. 172403-2]MBF9253368.1 hypothetical protein [Pontibacter sp. 172403-2]